MDSYRLIEYLEGALDQDAVDEVEKWASLSDENMKALESLYLLSFSAERMRAMKEVDTNGAYLEFMRKREEASRANKKRLVPSWQKIAGVAALCILLLSSAFFGTLYIFENDSKPFVVSTELGEKAEVTLPDGTKVWLNNWSHLEYQKSILSRKREASITGEAFFEVAHNKISPFIVTSNGSQIRVLGTKFNIRSNDDENFLAATLVEGAILFTHPSQGLSQELKPGDQLVFNKQTNMAELRRNIPTEQVTSWMNGKLTFNDATLEEITQTLERYYNVTIHFMDEKAKTERFYAEFDMVDNIYHILSMLELTNRFKYETNKRDIFIYSR